MANSRENVCTTVSLKYRFVFEKPDCDGDSALSVKYEPEPSRTLEVSETCSEADSSENVDEFDDDDVEFLRSLDPKEWKDQDHYAVLGLKNLRYKASDDDIKKAFRRKVLRHHPDKRRALGEEIRPDDDYFTCITKANEILGTPLKRRSYDSVDPEFDDSIPSTAESKKDDFFTLFPQFFELNSRWSEKKHVPLLGTADTDRDKVEKFYSFWYNFESWREFSYLDEEEKEKGQDREERRWIEKQNKVARAKRKKEEMSRIRTLVDLAYSCDPRIAKFKQDDKDKKLALKKAKLDAIQARKEEEERQLIAEKLAKEKLEAEEKIRNEAKRQEREIQKKLLKKERKTFRDTCKTNNYFSTNKEENLQHMTTMEKICELLSLSDLEKLNSDLKTTGRSAFINASAQINEIIEAERKKHTETHQKPTNNTEKQGNTNGKIQWTLENTQLLIKSVNLFPAGTSQRWETIANFMNQHGEFNNGLTLNAKDVLSKAKDLQNTDFSKSNLKIAANSQAYDNFEKEKRSVEVIANDKISKKIDDDAPWTPLEQQLLEQALKTFTSVIPDRWDKIADCIPNRTKKDCMKRYKELVEIVKAKKAAQNAVKVVK